MKKLFAILLVTVFASCGSSLEPPKSNKDYKNIIGKPIKIGNIVVAQYDFPKQMNWNDAKKACEALGDGWRLPSKDELNDLYQIRVVFDNGGFANDLYWSSTELGNLTLVQNFLNGYQYSLNKDDALYVRAVRALKQSAALKKLKSNTDYINIIGKPIKIGNIEVAQYDFPKKMNWEDAKIFCTNLGKGWRLPTKEELNILYQNKSAIGGFAEIFYWSSTEDDAANAWNQDFYDGYKQLSNKLTTDGVRAVRSF
jgi:hypothetical protein